MIITVSIGSTSFSTDVESYNDALNIFHMVAAREGLNAPPEKPQQERYTFRFGVTTTPIKAIREIREFTTMGLAEAKEVYEAGSFKFDCSYAAAEAFCVRLAAAGCLQAMNEKAP